MEQTTKLWNRNFSLVILTSTMGTIGGIAGSFALLPYPLMLLNRGICGFLGEILDYRWCITIGGTFTLLAGFVLILGKQKALRRIYEPEEERSLS